MATSSPKALLDRLCREPNESAWLEFKVDNTNPEAIGERLSACANAAILADKEKAFIVFGVENDTHAQVGTSQFFTKRKKGGELLSNWLPRLLDPKPLIEFVDFETDGKKFSIVVVEPTYDRPVKFQGVEYIRVGEHTKKLSEHPEHARAIWLATGRRRFEDATALPHQTSEQVFELLDTGVYYTLKKEPSPESRKEVLRRFCSEAFLKDDLEGGFDITNLGALLFARDLGRFPSVKGKSVRIIKYKGNNKSESEDEIEERKGYAVGFSGLLDYIAKKLPREEQYIKGVRTQVDLYPSTATREIVANALIHQDFTVSGAGPVVEIYKDRLEVVNPGNSLIEIDRILDERRSRNEKLAEAMRTLNLCEERGGGLDKALLEIERLALPPFEIVSSRNSMRVVVVGPKPFLKLTKAERMRACFYHCVLRWITHDPMSNASLRERFSLEQSSYQVVSIIISESIKNGRIIPMEEGQGNRNARYVPYWAR